jgi:hypothetical protein
MARSSITEPCAAVPTKGSVCCLFLFVATMPHQLKVFLKIQSSPKCKAWGKFRSAAYSGICKQEIFPATQQLGYNGVAVKANIYVMPELKSGFLLG